jgi:thioredoxin 1
MAGAVTEVTDATFQSEVLDSPVPVLVDFWAAWCGPCRLIAPLVEAIGEEYRGRARVVKVDVDTNQQYAAQFGISSIPALLFFKNGKVVDRIVGAVPKEQIARKLDSVIG